MKGRVACEISAGDELVLTEMMFNGVFNDLTVDQLVALLSCFVFDEEVKGVLNVFFNRRTMKSRFEKSYQGRLES